MNEFRQNDSIFKKMTITFNDDMKIKIFLDNNKNIETSYKWASDTLYVYDSKFDEYEPFALGSKDRLVIKMGLLYTHSASGSSNNTDNNYNYKIEDGLKEMNYSSFKDMKSDADTIAIYNKSLIFE